MGDINERHLDTYSFIVDFNKQETIYLKVKKDFQIPFDLGAGLHDFAGGAVVPLNSL